MSETNYMALGPVLEMVEQRRASLEREVDFLRKVCAIVDWDCSFLGVYSMYIDFRYISGKYNCIYTIQIMRKNCIKKMLENDDICYLENDGHAYLTITIEDKYTLILKTLPILLTRLRGEALIKFIDDNSQIIENE